MKRVLIVDDHEVVRTGVKRTFEDAGFGTAAFGEASTGADAIAQVRSHEWDLVILDISLGDKGGFEVLNQIRELQPRVPVLFLTMHSEPEYAKLAFKSGAAGYVTKDAPQTELIRAATKVMNGGKYVSDLVAEALAADLGRTDAAPPHDALSGREFAVLRLIASGKTVTEIAEILQISVKTVSTYRTRILEKMNMKTNSELMYYAIHNDLLR